LILDTNEYEILVIDNCSDDNSIKIVEDLKKEFVNIRFIANDKNV